MFEKVFPDGKKVVIENGVVALYNTDGSQGTNSNVDYYYDERGYGCQNDDQVADVYSHNFDTEYYHNLISIAGIGECPHCHNDIAG